MKIRVKTKSVLRKRAKRGMRGYPVATVAFYGPTGDRASKVAVGIIEEPQGEATALERWFSEAGDVRQDHEIEHAILDFIQAHGAKSVVMTDGLLGCPHEEGKDFPEGEACPQCPYWAGRDRFDGMRRH
jgi:hypothetical protein